ncbi:helix-turn-helix transcriptional regulator [Pseudomonas graminis]|uniref:helix-turn-helix transcriptional regulator n=1 Tax=Pseudomonas graminis TaxID=158627 RepID=UPI0010610F41|nr:AraC family transcriptional regulator [Pseudomonas graminis]
MQAMSPTKRPPHPLPSEPVRRVHAGPWMIELLPAAAYATRYVATQAAIGFAFESQRGLHAIGSDRVQPFDAVPNGLAFVPAGCDVLSESPTGGEYLRLLRTDGLALAGDHPFNNRIDAQAIALATKMRAALLQASAADDWEGWALALTDRIDDKSAFDAPLQGSINARRMRRLDEFIDAGIDGPLGVQAMAQMLGLSEGYFMRAFKNTTGKSPHSYLIDRRLAKVRSLMRDSHAGLAEIAHDCGFSSQAHMATAFRLRMGISPAKLRSQWSL